MELTKPIILFGPHASGKTHTAKALAHLLATPEQARFVLASEIRSMIGRPTNELEQLIQSAVVVIDEVHPGELRTMHSFFCGLLHFSRSPIHPPRFIYCTQGWVINNDEAFSVIECTYHLKG